VPIWYDLLVCILVAVILSLTFVKEAEHILHQDSIYGLSESPTMAPMDDLKISHKQQSVLDDVLNDLNIKFGTKKKALSATRGKVHDYLPRHHH